MSQENRDLDIAIVGMACRFPGARSPDEFWRNLESGTESIVPLSDEELRASGVPESLLADPAYVKVHAPIPEMKAFDAEFFGFSSREASILDPQHRHFLEVAWEAFEDAGHVAREFDGPVGVFAGVGHHHYFSQHLLSSRDLLRSVGFFLLRHTGNDKDFLPTRVSYLFNLRGPSIAVQTACSTSLVAVHLAVQSLLAGECSMALAGGVTIELPEGQGYKYAEGEILSPDGHCRPFDAASQGTVFGSGCGAVVLRRVKDAVADGDTIHAIIRATAINNDGSQKVGYLAPSVEGHAQVAAEALALADVSPASVTYIETHGTGTPVGDPIEIAALAQAYGGAGARPGSIRIGSVKSNIGHLDTAAGVASLIKVIQSMRHRRLAPTLNFTEPNPACRFPSTPFTVQDRAADWMAETPRRAGVSSLGVGGTNAHVLLEEAPLQKASAAPSTPTQLLVLSGRSAAAVQRQAARLADFLDAHPDAPLHDAAWTLQVGRQEMRHRAAFAADAPEEAVRVLRDESQVRQALRQSSSSAPPVTFLFAGGGAQYPGMGAGLYAANAAYRDMIDRGLVLLRDRHGIDLEPILFPQGDPAAAAEELERPSRSLPALFLTQAATCALWKSWGVRPAKVLGHSMGEYSAALESGVLSFEQGLALVVRRGELFERVPPGGMLSVALAADAVRPMLGEHLSIAAVNAPELCVVAGPDNALAALEAQLASREVECARVRIKIAAHSSMLEGILEDWRAFVRTIPFQPPRIPTISNLFGRELKAGEAQDPEYWVRQLRETVQFSDGVAQALGDGSAVLVECGSGRVLTTLARQHPKRRTEHELVVSMRRPDEPGSDLAIFAQNAGRLWSVGVPLDWAAIHGQPRRRIPLPTYPFERDEHWIARRTVLQPETVESDELVKSADLARWGFSPVWTRVAAPTPRPIPSQVLVLGGGKEFRDIVAPWLASQAAEVTYVDESDVFRERLPGRYLIDPERPEHFRDLFRELARTQRLPGLVIHAWNLGNDESVPNADRAGVATVAPLGSVLWLAQALALEQGPESVRVAVLTSGAASVAGEPLSHPMRAMAAATCRVINAEADGFSAHAIDVEWPLPPGVQRARALRSLTEELCGESPAAATALRGGERWEPGFLQQPLVDVADQPFRQGGVYLITGGLGGIGLEVAHLLARRVRARLVLASRTALPPESEWGALLADGRTPGDLRRRLLALRRLRDAGAEVEVVAADVSDRRQARSLVRRSVERFGALHGVIHAAGVLNDALLGDKTPLSIERVLRPKVHGALALDEATQALSLDVFALFSSTSAYQGLPGQTDYAAANAFLDAFAVWRASQRPGQSVSINWSVWQEIGMAATLADTQGLAVADAATRTAPMSHHVLDGVVLQTTDVLEVGGRIAPERHWVLDEHRLRGGHAVLPGTGYMDLIVAAAQRREPSGTVVLEETSFSIPCVVPDGEERELRVVIADQGDGRSSVLVRSRPVGAASGWVEHCVGRVSWQDTEDRQVDLAALRARVGDLVPSDRGESLSSHIDFGPRWRNLRARVYGHAEALVELELDAAHASDFQRTTLHPSLLDIATAGAQALLSGFVETEHFFVPLAYGRLVARAPLKRHVISHVRLRPGATAESDTAVFDVSISDPSGRVLVEVEEFTMFRLRDRSGFESASTPSVTAQASASSPLADALRLGILPAEGMEIFQRALAARDLTRVAIAPAGASQLLPRPTAVAAAMEGPDEAEASALETVPPRTSLQAEMVKIAAELLGAHRLGITEILVDRGLHSLLAVRFFNRLQRLTGRNVPLAALLEAPTIEGLALRFGDIPPDTEPSAQRTGEEASVDDGPDAPRGKYEGIEIPDGEAYILPPEEDAAAFSSLVALKPAGAKPPFFVIHARGGAVLNYQRLTTFVDRDQPVYGLQSQGLDGITEPLRSIEAMAAHYLKHVRQVQPHGPYRLGGGSLGGIIALEMAHQLRQAGEETAFIAMFDSWGPQVFMDTQRLSAAGHLEHKSRRVLQLLRERGLARAVRRVRRRVTDLAAEAAQSWAVRWHRLLQRTLRRQLPHAIRYQFVERINLAALRVYRPAPWDGDITLFRALDDPDFKPHDPQMGWSQTVRGNIRVVDCPGTHNTIMKGPVFGSLFSAELRRSHASSEPPLQATAATPR